MSDTVTSAPPENETEGEKNFAQRRAVVRTFATWGVIACTGLWTAFFFSFVIIGALFPAAIPDSWFLTLIKQHPSGTLGTATSAVSAFSVVAVLDILSRDPIKFKVLGIELEGAAGPVVLWVVCFLSIIVGGGYLWDKPGLVPVPVPKVALSAAPSTASSGADTATPVRKP